MAKIQVNLEQEYMDKVAGICSRTGVSRADLLRYMIDTLRLDELCDEEIEEWYNERHGIK